MKYEKLDIINLSYLFFIAGLLDIISSIIVIDGIKILEKNPLYQALNQGKIGEFALMYFVVSLIIFCVIMGIYYYAQQNKYTDAFIRLIYLFYSIMIIITAFFNFSLLL